MNKYDEEPVSPLRGFGGGGTLVEELLKQVDDFSHSIWQAVAIEAGSHLNRANALERLANAIERVTNAVLSDGQPVDAGKVETARVQMNQLRAAAEKMRSAATSMEAGVEIKGA